MVEYIFICLQDLFTFLSTLLEIFDWGTDINNIKIYGADCMKCTSIGNGSLESKSALCNTLAGFDAAIVAMRHLHCKPIPVIKTGFSLCTFPNREKPVFISCDPCNENRFFPVGKKYTGKSLFWPCTDPVRDCSALT